MRAPTISPESRSTDLPEPHELDARVREAQRMFGRTLASWASDCLILRARGIDARRWRTRNGMDGEHWYERAA
jgi:hypothetical protein